MKEQILSTRQLCVGYTSKAKTSKVLENLNLTLGRGELTCLLGPNGSGKSTLIRTIANIQKPLEGETWLNGARLLEVSAKQLARQLALVLTDRVSPGNLTSYALVALGRFPYTSWMGNLTEGDKKIIRWSLEVTGTLPFADRHIGELSDGERQKVMIARALAQQTDLIILDEPTAHLDSPNRIEIFHLLKSLAREANKAILLSTHDIESAIGYADRLWLVHSHSVEEGTPEDLVLKGKLEKAFAREGLVFNHELARFEKPLVLPGLEVEVEGAQPGVAWTKRALQRAGHQIAKGEAQIVIRVNKHKETWTWTLDAKSFKTVEELLKQLDNLYGNEMD
ncbi:MAG: ABC transporter ATP-binding protein [Bacteroidota bacterium]|nr:ABC transporter ATP-binding protein [Bacteroidota bacterium]